MPSPGPTAAGADRRTDILKSAAAAFRRRGYHGASVDEIASALEMTKGNLYYYFRNKEEILYACHEYSLDILLGLLHDVQGSPLPPDQQMRRLLRAFVHVTRDELQGTALTVDPHALSPPLLHKIVARRDEFDHGLRTLLQQGMDDGCFAAADPRMVAFAMIGAVHWLTKWHDPAGPRASDQIGQDLADYLLQGLLRRA